MCRVPCECAVNGVEYNEARLSFLGINPRLALRQNKPALNPNSEFCLMEPDLGNSHEQARTGSQEQLVEFQTGYNANPRIDPSPSASTSYQRQDSKTNNTFLNVLKERVQAVLDAQQSSSPRYSSTGMCLTPCLLSFTRRQPAAINMLLSAISPENCRCSLYRLGQIQ
ncbi:hypothetical protein R1flu_028780 [Riccia fluitans]|uniref:Uncharacterized protein n=1 Tax=Riccia fluitans TaxID=41844 RepID=A0ABD1XMM5_9MARC